MGETVFITGGLGFIGAQTAKKLVDAGDRVVIYDLVKSFAVTPTDDNYLHSLKQRLALLQKKALVIEGDIRDAVRLRRAINRVKPEKIIHFAGLPIADVADQLADEAISINFQGAANLLQAAAELKPRLKRFINISSSMVYGDFQYTPADEQHPTRPKGIYGITKLGAEHLTRFYANRFGFDYITIRPSAVYGPTDSNQRAVQLFIDNARQGRPIILHDGGRGKLDFTYVADLVQGVILALKADKVKNDTFNLTYGQGRSLAELAGIIKQYFPKTKIISRTIAAELKRPKRGTMDVSRAKKMLGYRPQYPLEKGVAAYLKFLEGK